MGGKWSSMDPSQVEVPEIKALLERDPYLQPYENEIRKRYRIFCSYKFISNKITINNLQLCVHNL